MITITGGKLTTWRRMAKMAVDRLVERDGREAPCRTDEMPLGHADRRRRAARVDGVCRATRFEPLAARYGHAAERVLASPPSAPELAGPMSTACPTCSPRSPSPPGASRRARSPTCCCAAPGSACWRPATRRAATSRAGRRDVGRRARLGRRQALERGRALSCRGRCRGDRTVTFMPRGGF